jgi:spermidine/putrescine transport system ATP-binding protein
LPDICVDIRGLIKSHGTTRAVDRLSVSVMRGEFFSVLGPSGSGKTTFLRLLAGLEQPDQGEIVIDGQPMFRDRSGAGPAGRRDGVPEYVMVPPNRRPVNLVFQSYALFPHLTTFENIAFGLRMRARPAVEIREAVVAAIEMVKLSGKEHRYPSQLSGGEQQRVALARALVNRPAVLLLDEPLSALDQQLRQEMQVELKAIQERVGITFIYVTHDQEEAMAMSDRLAVMQHGRLLQIGSPQELYEAPVSGFVAEFIGLSNRLTGRVASVDGPRCVVVVADLPMVLSRRPIHVVEGSHVTISIRPERIHLTSARAATSSSGGLPEPFDNTIPARIEKALYGGSDMLYLLRLTDQLLWKSRVPNSRSAQKRFLPGEQVSICWNADEGVTLTE